MSNPSFHIGPFGERGWLAQFEGFDDIAAGGLYANAVAGRLRETGGVTDAVAGVDSVALRFDPAQLEPETARALIETAIRKTPRRKRIAPGKIIDIPVRYGAAYGPDFDDVCARTGLAADELIRAHAAPRYRVVTLGYAPGFAYLGGLDARLDVPRHETPRARVEAGSVAVAGGMAGIYSLPSPGGWRIIGRTPMTLFGGAGASPFAFEPGAAVRFHSISEGEYKTLREKTA